MLTVSLAKERAPLSILCLGAHCDDIAIGCGGTLLRLLQEHPGSAVHWVAFASDATREAEERACAGELLVAARDSVVDIHSFRDGFFPSIIGTIKERFETLKDTVAPDMILTHRTGDRHQDHRTVAELTWNTFRDHLILEYEIAKYDADLGRPVFFVPLTESLARRKIDVIIRSFKSQADNHWFKGENFEALMRLRGLECNAQAGFAESFHARKLVL